MQCTFDSKWRHVVESDEGQEENMAIRNMFQHYQKFCRTHCTPYCLVDLAVFEDIDALTGITTNK
jgi:hypothetical protein